MPSRTPSNLKTKTIQLTGFSEYYNKIGRVEGLLPKVAIEAVNASTEPIHQEMRARAYPHRRTDAVYDSITKTEARIDGDIVSAEIGVGASEGKSAAGAPSAPHSQAWHGVFQEYGSPTFPADPFVRTSFKNNRIKVKQLQKAIFNKYSLIN